MRNGLYLGYYALRLAELVGPGGRVLAVEVENFVFARRARRVRPQASLTSPAPAWSQSPSEPAAG